MSPFADLGASSYGRRRRVVIKTPHAARRFWRTARNIAGAAARYDDGITTDVAVASLSATPSFAKVIFPHVPASARRFLNFNKGTRHTGGYSRR